MKSYSQRFVGLVLLALLLISLGRFMVPAHFGTIWGDRDFTDWSVPIANRLHDHQRLYEDGLHSPMPPLPYVLPRLLFPHGGVWLDGSLLNFGFQAGMILIVFWALAGEVGVAIALAAALAAIPVYLSMPKTMLYDSMAQFFVAVVGIATAAAVRHRNVGLVNPRRWLRLVLLALPLALLLLTKQNTAVGALAGAGIVLLLLPRWENFGTRCENLILVLVLTAVIFCALALAMGEFLNFHGLIHDVFVTGSEPKGGPVHMIKSLIIYSLQIGVVVGGLYMLVYIFNACFGTGIPLWHKMPGEAASGGIKSRVPIGPARATGLLVGAIVGSILGLALALIYARTGVSLKGTMMDTAWAALTLNAGLCLCLAVGGTLIFHVAITRGRDRGSYPLAPFAWVFLLSAVFHNLSVARLRWTVDNNPLVFLALVLIISSCVRRPQSDRQTHSPNPMRGGGMAAILGGFIVFIMWPLTHFLTLNIVNSAESWPEIHHLAGAKLRSESSGMRELVHTVRALANPSQDDKVLLLPNDPNVESWFERSSPKLSNAIIFTDQYWDRYVDQDFAELQAHPPKVIIIGPRNYWRFFCHGWHINGAAERLIDRVQEQMLAKDYELKSEQPIAYQGGTDYMDVYERKVP